MRLFKKVCIFATNIHTDKVIMNMKTMKSFGYILMLLVLGFGVSSCGDDYETRLHELLIKDMEFEASTTSITQSQQFRNEDMTNYSITSSESWCTAKIDYDTSTINVTVDARGVDTDMDQYSDRSCTVTITDVRSNDVRSFKVSQKQINEIKVTGSEYQAPHAGGDVTIELQKNVDYTVDIPESASSWITKKAATRGLEKSTIVLTIAENNSGGYRYASVVIRSTDGSIQRSVKISQLFTPSYSFDAKAFTVDELAQTVQVNVTANFKFETYPDGSWVTSGGRETISDAQFIQKLDISAFKEKSASRETTVEFYANIRMEDNVYKEIKETVTITQQRTLYIPVDSVNLAIGDSTLVEVVNTKSRSLVWSSSDEKEFTVDAKGYVKCISTEGDGKATITVKSSDGKYSDQIIAVAKKAQDLSKSLVCKWDSIESIKDGVTVKTLTFSITNNSTASIALTQYTAKKDSADASAWYQEKLSETLAAKGSRSFSLGAIPTTNYYMTLKYTYLNEKYVLGFSKNGVMTITKEEAPKATTTRRSARARRR